MPGLFDRRVSEQLRACPSISARREHVQKRVRVRIRVGKNNSLAPMTCPCPKVPFVLVLVLSAAVLVLVPARFQLGRGRVVRRDWRVSKLGTAMHILTPSISFELARLPWYFGSQGTRAERVRVRVRVGSSSFVAPMTGSCPKVPFVLVLVLSAAVLVLVPAGFQLGPCSAAAACAPLHQWLL